MRLGKTAVFVISSSMLAMPAVADVSEASKLGANAGAMQYCRDNFMTDDDNGRYNLLVAATTKDFGKLAEGEDKAKALLMRKAAEDGDYLGSPLDAGRCESIRKILLTQYSIN